MRVHLNAAESNSISSQPRKGAVKGAGDRSAFAAQNPTLLVVPLGGMSERWRVCSLICAAIAISYFDRQTLPVAIAAIQREIPITNTQFSELQTCFLLAYAVMY